MKHLRLVLSLCLAGFIATFTLASADDTDSGSGLVITKATDKTAKITIGSKSATVPITFDQDASWDSLKDSYSVSPSTAEGLENGTMCINIGSDGTATFKMTKPMGKSGKK
jgi:hypothetical protein